MTATPAPGGGNCAAPVSGGHLRARSLIHTFYRDQVQVPALRGIDLDIPAGCQLAIMGPSGSGKSTLLHVLAGILTPTGGQVWVDDTQLNTLSEKHTSRLRLERFGFVFQDGQLLPELSNEENVALPLMLNGVPKAAAKEAARSALASLGLGELGRFRPGQLSGGQAQRVAIARAIATRPAVVFADEPTGALDQGTSREVMAALTAACKASGSTLVVVTHDEGVAAALQWIIRMEDGQIKSLEGEL